MAGSLIARVSCWGNMESRRGIAVGEGMLLLAIDTCGPTGSVALGRLASSDGASLAKSDLDILGETELEGRSYSSTLVMGVGDLLKDAGVGLTDLGAIVAVHGPGSFTGVRVGLSAVKGLAEPSQIPAVVVSRLEVLAAKAGVETAALDAHRGEVFLRIGSRAAGQHGTGPRTVGPIELLAGAAELRAIDPAPARVAVCDDEAVKLVGPVWASAELIRVTAPTAADALRLVWARAQESGLVEIALADVALLDGNYLRRPDAEIFGEAAEALRR
jgi:tRNA threonylcarbamoyladenosine biosynthesis protein TsaB